MPPGIGLVSVVTKQPGQLPSVALVPTRWKRPGTVLPYSVIKRSACANCAEVGFWMTSCCTSAGGMAGCCAAVGAAGAGVVGFGAAALTAAAAAGLAVGPVGFWV